MIVNYGSPAYFLFIFMALALAFVMFLLLRRRPMRVKRRVILALMLLNVFQHLFKSVLYPHLGISGFTALSTAYNMCALLILISPIALLFKIPHLRDLVFPIGTVAGIIAIAVPYWSIGKPATDPDYIRSFICHALLFTTSVLPLLFGIHTPRRRRAWCLGLSFIGAIILILLNDAVCVLIGIYPGIPSYSNVYYALSVINPLWSFGPPPEFAFLRPLFDFFGGLPVVWYALPMYIGITLLAYPIFRPTLSKRLRKMLASSFDDPSTDANFRI